MFVRRKELKRLFLRPHNIMTMITGFPELCETSRAEIIAINNQIGALGEKHYPVTNATFGPDWFEDYEDKYAISSSENVPEPLLTFQAFLLQAR